MATADTLTGASNGSTSTGGAGDEANQYCTAPGGCPGEEAGMTPRFISIDPYR